MTATTAERTRSPRKYHVVTIDAERTITADDAVIRSDNSLALVDAHGDIRVAFAAGFWRYCELEGLDE